MVNILVCIKQVPWTTDIKTDSETGHIIRSGVASAINPFDYHALEAALQIKDQRDAHISALTMGPPQAEHALHLALALGCDEGIILTDRAFAGADTLATSYTLAQGIKKLDNADLILCGVKSTDGDTAQVGPEIAEFLELPHVCYVEEILSLDTSRGIIFVKQVLEDGFREIEVKLPCVLTISKNMNVPRKPTLKGRLNADKKPIKRLTSADLQVDPNRLGVKGSPTLVKNIFEPEGTKDCKMLQGDPEKIVNELVDELGGLKLW